MQNNIMYRNISLFSLRTCYDKTLNNFINCMNTTRMIGWIGTGESLTGWNRLAALAGIPDCPRVSATRTGSGTVVEAVSFARIIITARPTIKDCIN